MSSWRSAGVVVRFFSCLVALVSLTAPAAGDEAQPYIGEWSNGRGEVLVITATTIKFANDRAVPYRDVTRGTDGSSFELQLNASKPVNGFGGNTLALELDGETLKITAFRSHAGYMQDGEPQSIVTWFREGADE
jgi:hypothetical protein